MLLAHLVEGRDDGELKQRPHALDAVVADVADNPLLLGMVNRVVARVVTLNGDVALPYVGVDRLGIVVDIAVDEQVERLTGHAGDLLEAHLLAALECATQVLFVGSRGPGSHSYCVK